MSSVQSEETSNQVRVLDSDPERKRKVSAIDENFVLLKRNLQFDPFIVKSVHGPVSPPTTPRNKPFEPQTTIGMDLDGLHVKNILPGGPIFATRQVAERDKIVEVDGRQVTESNIERMLAGLDMEGSPVTLKVAKAATNQQDFVTVTVRRVRRDVVAEQQKAFEFLSAMRQAALARSDGTGSQLVEDVGQQIVRILLDRQDKETALTLQYSALQVESTRLCDDLHKNVRDLFKDSVEASEITELKTEIQRHLGIESEMKRLTDALEKQLNARQRREVELIKELSKMGEDAKKNGVQEDPVQLREQLDMSQTKLRASEMEVEAALKREQATRERLEKQLKGATAGIPKEIKSLEEEISALQATVQELRENKEVAEKRNGDLKAQCEKLEQVTALKVNDAQADQDTKTQLAALQIELVKTNDRLYEKEETVKDLEKRLAGHDARARSMEQDVEEANSKVEQARAELGRAREEAKLLHTKVAAFDSIVPALQEQVKALTRQLADAGTSLGHSADSKDVALLQAQVAELRNRLALAQHSLPTPDTAPPSRSAPNLHLPDPLSGSAAGQQHHSQPQLNGAHADPSTSSVKTDPAIPARFPPTQPRDRIIDVNALPPVIFPSVMPATAHSNAARDNPHHSLTTPLSRQAFPSAPHPQHSMPQPPGLAPQPLAPMHAAGMHSTSTSARSSAHVDVGLVSCLGISGGDMAGPMPMARPTPQPGPQSVPQSAYSEGGGGPWIGPAVRGLPPESQRQSQSQGGEAHRPALSAFDLVSLLQQSRP